MTGRASMLSALVPLVFAGAAYAGGGPPFDVTGYTYDYPAEAFGPGSCPFPINFYAPSGKLSFIDLPGGRHITIGPGDKLTITNLNDTTKSITLTVPGSWHYAFDGAGNTVVSYDGRNIVTPLDGGIYFTIGHFTEVIGPGNTLVQAFSGTGQFSDVCELID